MWKKCSEGQTDASCSDPAGGYIWASVSGALQQCYGLDFAGYTDWRLPNVRELMSIVDYGKNSAPTINATYFPGTQSSYYWTSTTYVHTPTNAWYVNFANGYVNKQLKTSGASTTFVRCVRGGP
jgi:hypothetical protein